MVWYVPVAMPNVLKVCLPRQGGCAHGIGKQSQTSSRHVGDYHLISSGAKWLVLRHGVQHVDSDIPGREVVGSSTLVWAFTPCASTCVCRCWIWTRFKGVDDEFFTIPDGDKFWETYDYITGFIVNQLHLKVDITGSMPSQKTRLRSSWAWAFAQRHSSWARWTHRVPVPVAGPAWLI